MAYNSKEAFAVARKFGSDYKRKFVVKAQVQSTGRTKGYFKENNFEGGIHTVDSPHEVAEVAGKMCGKKFVNKFTGPDGYLCNCVYIMEELDVEKEIFLSITLDQKKGMPVITYSGHGGQALNRIEALHPDDLHRLHIDQTKAIDIKELLVIGQNLGLGEKSHTLSFLVKNLFECFEQRDCESVTINPLIYTKQQKFFAANPRITIDPNSHYRQAEILC